ncbi:MAG: YkgJ family cysteine cluster protein [Flavobacteriales bacterium]|nr:YkgJ family cysteine cluster protein [Flavobacteriales bacterium]
MDKRTEISLKKKLKKLKPRQLDKSMHEGHNRAFSCIDCLQCANCCKTTGPLFTDKDIERISSKLKMSQLDFIGSYLRQDEDGDMVLQKVPCPFLGVNNYCDIYEFRPKACREYPHTDRAKQHQILDLTFKNAEICPAVEDILTQML